MSPWILAVDTTHEYGSLALLHGAELLEEIEMHAPHGFADVLYGHLGELLHRHGRTAGSIDCFASTSGPGSFTGVRVGLACVKGLAEATGRPAVAVSNLQAIATFGAGPLRVPIVDARRGDIYGAVYDAASRLVMPEVVTRFGPWSATLPADVEFVTFDFTLPLAGTRFAQSPVSVAPRALAAAVGRLALHAEPQDPAALDANYVRRCDAELAWKE